MKLPSPIRWIGGKSRLLKHILPLIEPHPGESVFVDCFGGSGVVTLNKTRHPSETYNDMNGDLVNLFRVIRDPDGVVHLWWELINTPNSREEFRDSIPNEKFSPLTPVCTRATACGNTKRDPNGPPSKQKNGTARVELILTNFDRKTRKRLS